MSNLGQIRLNFNSVVFGERGHSNVTIKVQARGCNYSKSIKDYSPLMNPQS